MPPSEAFPSAGEAPARSAPSQPEPALPITLRSIEGERTKITEDVDVTFTGNNHEIAQAGQSPLGVSLTIHRDSRDIHVLEWIELPGPVRFTAAGVTFVYVSHEYDRAIEFEVAAVERVASP